MALRAVVDATFITERMTTAAQTSSMARFGTRCLRSTYFGVRLGWVRDIWFGD